MLGSLARFCRPLVLVDSSLLLGGLLLTSANLLLLGWSIYAIGHVLAIVAFFAIGANYRERMDAWSWAALIVVELGLVLALPQVASIWTTYSLTSFQAQMIVPAQVAPIGRFAELVLWVGVAFFGLAARGTKALPSGVGWMFTVAAVVGLLAALVGVWIVTPLWWVPAMLVFVLALVAIGGSAPETSAHAAQKNRHPGAESAL